MIHYGRMHGIPQSILDEMDALGFSHGETGGGCTAFTKNDGEAYWMVTDVEDPTAPKSPEQSITIGYYNADGYDQFLYRGAILAEILSGEILLPGDANHA